MTTKGADLKLTAKQEAFCLAYIETNNASEAYRRAYDADKMKAETINKRSSELMQNGAIAGRLEQLREPVRERAQITLESHLERLNHLSLMAEDVGQYSAAIKAEESRGKVAGLYVEKIDLQSSDASMSPKEPVILNDFYAPNTKSES